MAGAGLQEEKGAEPGEAIQTSTQINPRVTRTIITAKVKVRVTKATRGTAVTGAAISRSRPIRVSTIIVRGDITIGSVEEASTIAEVVAEAGEEVKVAGVVGTRIAAAQEEEEGAASAIRIPPRWKWGTIVNDNGRRAPVRTPARTPHKMATNRGVDTGVAGAGTTGAQAEEEEEGEGSEGAGGTTEEIASEGEPPIEEGAPQVHKEETGGDSPVRVG